VENQWNWCPCRESMELVFSLDPFTGVPVMMLFSFNDLPAGWLFFPSSMGSDSLLLHLVHLSLEGGQLAGRACLCVCMPPCIPCMAGIRMPATECVPTCIGRWLKSIAGPFARNYKPKSASAMRVTNNFVAEAVAVRDASLCIDLCMFRRSPLQGFCARYCPRLKCQYCKCSPIL